MSGKDVKETKPESKAEPEAKTIRAVYGRMVDPHTNEEFTTTVKPTGKITSWVQCQIDAGKLVLA